MILAALFFLFIYLIYISVKKPRGYPPGPFRVPLVGDTLKIHPTRPYKTWDELRKKYGEVLGLHFGSQPIIVVNGWEAIKEGLANDDFNNRPEVVTFKDIYNNNMRGVMFTNGDLWKVQRRFTMFHLRNLGFGKSSHESVIHEELSEVIEEFKEKKGQPFSIQTTLGSSGINILWAILGGKKFSRKDEKLHELVDLIISSFRAGKPAGVIDAAPFLRHIFPNISGYKEVLTSFTDSLNVIKKSIAEHKTSLDPNNPRDFIDVFLVELQKPNKDESFTDLQLAAVCNDLFNAGIETSSSHMTFCIMYLCLFPEIQKKVHEELDRVVGRDRLPNVDDKVKLTYVDAFMQEVMRIRCPAPHTVPHYSKVESKLQGYRIPKDSIILFNLRSIMMDTDFWGDPENFKPERFLNADGSLKKYERMIPFGKGRRICLGESLARMTTYLTFTALAQNFFFSFPPGGEVKDTEGFVGFTLGPPKFKIIAKPR